ncbi:type VI secretion system-associated protein TagF [Thiosocius teredinicola]|uniref:type VI secretion system-associated protein TagF n=1 Tax=Thiosocius teredinicola TaxID=1973002 RepID=UPI000990FEA6
MATQQNGATYFGKVPARGDFIKGNGHTQLIGRLDEWISGSMAMLADDPRWKIVYDSMPQLNFAFVGAHSGTAIVGHLKSSMDASQRRFPFLAAASISRGDSLLFRCGPISFSGIWNKLHTAADIACSSDDPATALHELIQFDCTAQVKDALQGDPLGTFVRNTTLQRLAEQLTCDGRPVDVRRIILAIGLLLRPTINNAALRIEKGLLLPLPAESSQRDQVAALWVYLVSAFLRNTQTELQLLLGQIDNRHCMVIGFNGASPRTLLSLIAPSASGEANLVLDDPEWIEEHHDLSHDYGVAKLSTYLQQPGLTLEEAVNTFREVFFGE